MILVLSKLKPSIFKKIDFSDSKPLKSRQAVLIFVFLRRYINLYYNIFMDNNLDILTFLRTIIFIYKNDKTT